MCFYLKTGLIFAVLFDLSSFIVSGYLPRKHQTADILTLPSCSSMKILLPLLLACVSFTSLYPRNTYCFFTKPAHRANSVSKSLCLYVVCFVSVPLLTGLETSG